MKIPVNKLFTFASLIGCFGLIQVINAQVPLGVSNQSLQQAQAKVGFSSFSPQWEKEFQIPFPQDPSRFLTVPAFKESMLDDKIANLPFYKVMIPLSGSEALTLLQSSVGDESDVFSSIYDLPLQSVPGGLQGDYYPASNVVLGERVTWIKKDYQIVKIYPIRIAVSGGSYKKAGKVEYNLGKIPYQSPYAARSFNKTATATSSVLSSGRWFKIAVTHDGIYKLDAAYFASIGIDPATVDPRKIRIHGNGGGMLPQPNSTFRHDDLAENSIYVAGESDGVFNNGDYLLFFGGTPHPWAFDSNKVWNAYYPAYYHFQNVYSDTNYYFLTVGQTPGKRISNQPNLGGATYTPTSTLDYMAHEEDLYNPIYTGRVWMGETFDFTTSRLFNFPVSPLAAGSNIHMNVRASSRSNYNATFTISENGVPYSTLATQATNTGAFGSYHYRPDFKVFDIPASNINDNSIDINISYNKPDLGSIGWLDFIELNYYKQLSLPSEGSWYFNLSDNLGPGQIHQFNIANANSGWMVWDISDRVNVSSQDFVLNGGTMSFGIAADARKRLVAFNAAAFETPAGVNEIPNQNLHGLPQADFFIFSAPDFMASATNLANFHRTQNSMDVEVVNINQVFNEFSSGAKDPTAIRDFLKLFYDRAGSNVNDLPRFALMFGDGTYDYKNKVPGVGGNYTITYQSRKSFGPIESYTSDDYFGFLDESEGFWGENSVVEGGTYDILQALNKDTLTQTHLLDVGFGRIPCNSVLEAEVVVDKIINYKTNPASFGPWRNKLVLIADHKDLDSNIHAAQADTYTGIIEAEYPCINIDKIYLDNYNMVNTPNGTRFPDGKEEMRKKMEEGSLILNYTGHGGETGWSNSKIFELPDIGSLTNGYKLPLYITATCEFGRWDDHLRQSGAEMVLLNPHGGSIAMFTTVRVVYSHPNFELNKKIYNHIFDWDSVNNRHFTLGEVFMRAKNDSWPTGIINNRNFTMLGDPALTLNFPQYYAFVDSINGKATTNSSIDSIKSLSLVNVKGHVEDDLGNPLPGFTGTVAVTVFDKPSKFTTKRAPFTFFWQKNRLFNGLSEITNGRFEFSFVVPVDISYEAGGGKISLYFDNQVVDGGGCKRGIAVGGTGDIVDEKGPEVQVMMNDEKWAEGGMTGPDPLMLVKMFDDNGINTSGNGIGHELTCIFDEDDRKVIVLNEFYTAEKNNYKKGNINYNFKDLADGEHTVRVKIWDVANNSAEDMTRFVVADNAKIALGHVLNYPNPFTTFTKFIIEHNSNGASLDASIKIFTVSGKLVKSLKESFFAEGNLFCDLTWDGLDEWGESIGRGVYVYQVTLKNKENGQSISAFEKLVVLR